MNSRHRPVSIRQLARSFGLGITSAWAARPLNEGAMVISSDPAPEPLIYLQDHRLPVARDLLVFPTNCSNGRFPYTWFRHHLPSGVGADAGFAATWRLARYVSTLNRHCMAEKG